MSSSKRLPEGAPAASQVARAPILATILRVMLVSFYPVLAHVAAIHSDHRLAAMALADILLVVLLDGLLVGRKRPVLLLLLAIPGLLLLSRSPLALLLLLVMPALLLAIVALGFARTLRAGRTPLIASIIEVLEGDDAANLPAPLARYARGLTRSWAILLGCLALVNLALALCAMPGGVFASLGVAPPIVVSNTQWSWFANGFNYALVALFFVAEFIYRRHCFPERVHGFRQFASRILRMGPAFWRRALH